MGVSGCGEDREASGRLEGWVGLWWATRLIVPPFVRLTAPEAAKEGRSGRGRGGRGRLTRNRNRWWGRWRNGDLEALGDDLSVTDRTPSGVVLHGERKRRTGSEQGTF